MDKLILVNENDRLKFEKVGESESEFEVAVAVTESWMEADKINYETTVVRLSLKQAQELHEWLTELLAPTYAEGRDFEAK